MKRTINVRELLKKFKYDIECTFHYVYMHLCIGALKSQLSPLDLFLAHFILFSYHSNSFFISNFLAIWCRFRFGRIVFRLLHPRICVILYTNSIKNYRFLTSHIFLFVFGIKYQIRIEMKRTVLQQIHTF